MPPTITFVLALAGASSALAGLPVVGPDYSRPATALPSAYRDIAWSTSIPSDRIASGEWWSVYDDDVLNDLQNRALAANQDLRAAAARVEQARAAAGIAGSAGWPQLSVNGALVREQNSQTTDNVMPRDLSTTYRVPFVASWEIDLFGRVRRLRESARADAAGSASTFAALQLALTADVATHYFLLRAVDREATLVRETASLRRGVRDLIRSRVKIGVAGELDEVRAEAELAITEAEFAGLTNRRAALRNALAVLVGVGVGNFDVAANSSGLPSPAQVPSGLPSGLLERRANIIAAELSLAAANARIGVAKAAFFPAISLTGSAGYASGDIDRLFQADSRIWSIGPSLYLPLFQGGRNQANLRRSRAAFEESVALYRQRVLTAFREVQDALTATQLLAEQSAAQTRALEASRRAAALAQIRYDAGYVSYLEVLDAQRTALASERATIQLTAARLATNVALFKSLGGGWSSREPFLGQNQTRHSAARP